MAVSRSGNFFIFSNTDENNTKGGKIIDTDFLKLPHPQFTEKGKLNMIKIFHYISKILHAQHCERCNEMFASHSNMKGINLFTYIGTIIPVNSQKRKRNGLRNEINLLTSR